MVIPLFEELHTKPHGSGIEVANLRAHKFFLEAVWWYGVEAPPSGLGREIHHERLGNSSQHRFWVQHWRFWSFFLQILF